MSPTPSRPGRPRASSKEMLEEAAAELFVENSYERTTIEQIAQRAGVSRNTFFNYFSSKGDLLWARLDGSADVLAERLAAQQRDDPQSTDPHRTETHRTDPLRAVEEAVVETLALLAQGPTPLVLTQFEVMGVDDELRAAGLARALQHADALERFLAPRLRQDRPALARAVALAVVGAAASAVGEWATAGPARRPLADTARELIAPVLDGYRRASAASL